MLPSVESGDSGVVYCSGGGDLSSISCRNGNASSGRLQSWVISPSKPLISKSIDSGSISASPKKKSPTESPRRVPGDKMKWVISIRE